MAKNISKLARRYAKALLSAIEAELGNQGTPTPAQQAAEALNAFATAWVEDPELRVYLMSPRFPLAEREAALSKIAETSGMSSVLKRFLLVVLQRGRISSLEEIAAGFSGIADRAAGIVQVEVTSARDIDAGERRDIEIGLSAKIDGRPIFSWSVDPEILGGLVVTFAGKVLDGSIRGQLQRMQNSLQV